jgi:MFS family permease
LLQREAVVAIRLLSRRFIGVPHFATLAELVQTFAARTALYAFSRDRLELISYRQLADAIDRGARALRSRGADRDRSVLLWAPNSPAWIVAYFAVVRAGATAIPIDNQSTLANVAAVIEHADPCLLLTTVANLTVLQASGRVPDVLLLDGEDGEPRAFRGSTAANGVRLPEIEPRRIASLLYTSGTTGAPKAVPLASISDQSRRDLAAAIRTARALLRQGYSIVWFPEGRRSPTGARSKPSNRGWLCCLRQPTPSQCLRRSAARSRRGRSTGGGRDCAGRRHVRRAGCRRRRRRSGAKSRVSRGRRPCAARQWAHGQPQAASSWTQRVDTRAHKHRKHEGALMQAHGTALWSRAVTVTAVVVALLSPFLGAIADRGGYRKALVVAFTWLCIVATVALYFVQPGQVAAALALFVLADVAFELADVFYNAFLPDLAPQSRIGRISGFGWGIGYIGGLLALALALVTLVQPDTPWFGFTHADGESVRATNLLAAAWFAVFSVPLLLFVHENRPDSPPARQVLRDAVVQLRRTFAEIRKYRQVARFLLARLVYNDALVTIFAFGGIYAAETFRFSLSEVLLFGIVSTSPRGSVRSRWDTWTTTSAASARSSCRCSVSFLRPRSRSPRRRRRRCGSRVSRSAPSWARTNPRAAR